MKKTVLKIMAAVMAIAMLCAFAGCTPAGGEEELITRTGTIKMTNVSTEMLEGGEAPVTTEYVVNFDTMEAELYVTTVMMEMFFRIYAPSEEGGDSFSDMMCVYIGKGVVTQKSNTEYTAKWDFAFNYEGTDVPMSFEIPFYVAEDGSYYADIQITGIHAEPVVASSTYEAE